METGTPSIGRVLTMVLFALSCAGLLLFLWLSFGGNVPFNPEGYRIRISFPYAQQMGNQADVRISGVNVGKVVDHALDPDGNRTIALIQIDRKFAPIHKDTRAILRLKTIIGETYVELTPGTPGSPMLPDGSLLSRSQVQPAVQLDQVVSTFDPATRKAFQVWQQSLAQAVGGGNDQNLNDVLGNLPTFAADADSVLQVLDIEHNSVVNLLKNGDTVFSALDSNQGALRNVITSGESTFSETAANQAALSDTFHVFPTFLTQSRLTLARIKSFSLNTDPLIKELDPVAQQLAPTMYAVDRLSPYLRHLFTNLGPLIDAAKTGLPAITEVVSGARPLLGAVGPFLEQLNPILTWLSLHQQLVSDFLSNGAAGIAAEEPTTTYGGGGGLSCDGVPCGHYLRQFSPQSTPALSNTRDPNNRGNDYPPPLWLADLTRAFSAGGSFPGSFAYPSWDCLNTPTHGPKPVTGNPPQQNQACWVNHPPGSVGSQIPHITPAKYSSK